MAFTGFFYIKFIRIVPIIVLCEHLVFVIQYINCKLVFSFSHDLEAS